MGLSENDYLATLVEVANLGTAMFVVYTRKPSYDEYLDFYAIMIVIDVATSQHNQDFEDPPATSFWIYTHVLYGLYFTDSSLESDFLSEIYSLANFYLSFELKKF